MSKAVWTSLIFIASFALILSYSNGIAEENDYKISKLQNFFTRFVQPRFQRLRNLWNKNYYEGKSQNVVDERQPNVIQSFESKSPDLIDERQDYGIQPFESKSQNLVDDRQDYEIPSFESKVQNLDRQGYAPPPSTTRAPYLAPVRLSKTCPEGKHLSITGKCAKGFDWG